MSGVVVLTGMVMDREDRLDRRWLACHERCGLNSCYKTAWNSQVTCRELMLGVNKTPGEQIEMSEL